MSESTIELTTIRAPEDVAIKDDKLNPPSNTSLPSIADEASAHFRQTLDVTSKSRTAAIIASVTFITAIGSLLNGATTVMLPTLARDLDISDALLLWPSSIQALTCGCTLLLFGSIADALGSRFTYVLGSVLQSAFVLGCGLSQTATEILTFRALSGIAISFCLPSAVSIITHSFVGRRRNWAFAAMGGGQPVGFALGLTLGGVLTDSIGWRWAFHFAAIFNSAVTVLALWGLPKDLDASQGAYGSVSGWRQKWQQVKEDIDWVGALIASASLALLSYVFAVVTGSTSDIREPANIAMLCLAFALIPVFILWVGRQEKLGKPAIIPNSIWRNRTFTVMCLAIFLTWGSFNGVETILSFYFQDVQSLSATEASLRFLPAPVAGVGANIVIGFLVHRVSAAWLTISGCTIALAAPFVMTFATPQSGYWSHAFLANVFNPIGADALYTVANLVITSIFPSKTQALAGGIFNTISQIGKSVGLALVAVTASSVTAKSHYTDKHSAQALMSGYHAAFWLCFGWIVGTLVLSTWGLRKIGKVGHKRD